jgi:hypothetical protein
VIREGKMIFSNIQKTNQRKNVEDNGCQAGGNGC